MSCTYNIAGPNEEDRLCGRPATSVWRRLSDGLLVVKTCQRHDKVVERALGGDLWPDMTYRKEQIVQTLPWEDNEKQEVIAGHDPRCDHDLELHVGRDGTCQGENVAGFQCACQWRHLLGTSGPGSYRFHDAAGRWGHGKRITENGPAYLQEPGSADPRELWVEHVDLNDEWENDRPTAVSIEGKFPDGTEFGFELLDTEVDDLIEHLQAARARRAG
jgi:hypothetical protein